MSFIAPHLLEDNDFHPDQDLVTSTDHPVEESTADDGIHTSVEGKETVQALRRHIILIARSWRDS